MPYGAPREFEFATAVGKTSSWEGKRRGSQGEIMQNGSELENGHSVHLRRSPRLDGWWAAWRTCAAFPQSAYKHVGLHTVHILCGHILNKSTGSATEKVRSSLVIQKCKTWLTQSGREPDTAWSWVVSTGVLNKHMFKNPKSKDAFMGQSFSRSGF